MSKAEAQTHTTRAAQAPSGHHIDRPMDIDAFVSITS